MKTSKNDKKLIKLTTIAFKNYKSLPMAVYITNTEGRIIKANKAALELFNISKLTPESNIEKYYADVRQRSTLMEKLRTLQNGHWEKNQSILFSISGKYKSISFSSQIYKSENKILLGMINLAQGVTELERFKEFGPYIPVGFFQISSKREHIYTNKEFWKIFGYNEGEVKLPFSVTRFFKEKSDFDEIMNELTKTPKTFLSKKNIKLKRKDGSTIIADLIISPQYDTNGNLISSKGLIKDITIQHINNFAPIGIYMLESKNDEKILTYVNDTFSDIHKDFLGLNQSFLGKNISEFYESSAELEKLELAILEAEEKGNPLMGYDIRLKNGKHLIINTERVLSPEGNLELEIGAVYDVTENVSRWAREIEKEIAGFLHTFSSMLVYFGKNFSNIIKSIGNGYIGKGNSIDYPKVEKALKFNTSVVEKELNNLLLENLEKKYINQIIAEKIKKFLLRISDKKGHRVISQAIWINEIISIIKEYFKEYSSPNLPKDIRSKFNKYFTEINILTNLISIQNARLEAKSMSQEIALMKEYIATKNFNYGKLEEINLLELIDEVIESLGEFSRTNKIEIIKNYEKGYIPKLEGRRQQLKMAIYNVIHNAIKYSFKVPESHGISRVSVSVNNTFLNRIKISIQNKGVGIDKKKEIDNNRIFEFGIRGLHSREGGRLGTGIGLFHTKKVIEYHGGSVGITSERVGGNSHAHKIPHLTTVTIFLN